MEWTGQVYADCPAVAAEITIDAPPERVWGMVSDIFLMPRLSSELQEVAWLDGATGPAAGRRFTGRNANEYQRDVGDDQHDHRVRPAALLHLDGRGSRPSDRLPGGSPCGLTGRARCSSSGREMGPGRSGLSIAIDAMPEKEQKIVFVRLRE